MLIQEKLQVDATDESSENERWPLIHCPTSTIGQLKCCCNHRHPGPGYRPLKAWLQSILVGLGGSGIDGINTEWRKKMEV